MKGNFLVILLVFFSWTISCEEKDCCVMPKIELQGTFSHEIPNCDNAGSNEINCTEWLEFIDEKKVDILYGGGDIVYSFQYEQKDNMLHLQGPATSSFRPIFEVVDAQTLIRVDTKDIWKKMP